MLENIKISNPIHNSQKNIHVLIYFLQRKMFPTMNPCKDDATEVLSSTLASLYATLLVCFYVAFEFTKLVTFPNSKVS